jgi:hypothetical protein
VPLFGRRPPTPIPDLNEAQCTALLERYGRERLQVAFDSATRQVGEAIYPIYQRANADPAAWYDGLERCALASASGWAWVGAARLAAEVGLEGTDTDPNFARLNEQALAFMRRRAIPRAHLNGYENRIWFQNHDGEQWIAPLPGRPNLQSPITELEPGEEREVAVLAGIGNCVRVRRDDAAGEVVARLYRVTSNDDPTLVPDDEPSDRAATMSELYARIAAGLGSPPPQYDPELEPYFPFPPPDVS